MATGKEDKINCGEVEKVGRSIHLACDDVPVSEASAPRSKQKCLLGNLSEEFSNGTIHIDLTGLFMQRMVLVEEVKM